MLVLWLRRSPGADSGTWGYVWLTCTYGVRDVHKLFGVKGDLAAAGGPEPIVVENLIRRCLSQP